MSAFSDWRSEVVASRSAAGSPARRLLVLLLLCLAFFMDVLGSTSVFTASPRTRARPWANPGRPAVELHSGDTASWRAAARRWPAGRSVRAPPRVPRWASPVYRLVARLRPGGVRHPADRGAHWSGDSGRAPDTRGSVLADKHVS